MNTASSRHRRARGATIVIAAGVAVFVAVHLGLAGAAITHIQWTMGTVVVAALLVLVKLVGAALIGRRRAQRHGKTTAPPTAPSKPA